MNVIEWLTKLEQSATPGPWVASEAELDGYSGISIDNGVWTVLTGFMSSQSDVDLIAAMRNAIPDLLAVVAMLLPYEPKAGGPSAIELIRDGNEALARLQGDKEG